MAFAVFGNITDGATHHECSALRPRKILDNQNYVIQSLSYTVPLLQAFANAVFNCEHLEIALKT